MLSKAIPLLCLLATAASQYLQKNVDVNRLTAIFGTPPPKNTWTPCTTPDGKAGECVAYYNCINNTMNSDGSHVIDVRFNSEAICKPIFESCCPVPDIKATLKPSTFMSDRGCGYRNPEGVGFETTGDLNGETKFAEFPWTCGILRIKPAKASDSNGLQLQIYVGGGSIIHPSVVLTAAHYAVKPNLKVRAGEWDTQITQEPYPYQERAVESAKIHQDFNRGNLFYDIALLFLTQPMDLAPNVGVACLPPPPPPPYYTSLRVPGGTKCFATGWGKDKFEKEGIFQNIMKKTEVPVVNRDTCQAQLRRTRLGRYFQLHKSFMCAGGEPGKDTCTGDGGSPLSCPIESEENRYMQSGIVAWGIGCGTAGVPGVYVDVAFFRKWVDDQVAGKGYDPKAYTF